MQKGTDADPCEAKRNLKLTPPVTAPRRGDGGWGRIFAVEHVERARAKARARSETEASKVKGTGQIVNNSQNGRPVELL